MNSRTLAPIIALITLGLVLVSQSTYIVDESEQVIITQFGQPMGGTINTPGLKFRVPFVQQVNRFDKRILDWDGNPERMPTKDKKYLWVDATARWRIVDPLKFLQSVGDESGAQTRLDDILDGTTRTVIARHDLISVVRSTNQILTAEQAEDIDFELDYPSVEVGQEDIIREITKLAKPIIMEFGIDLMDVRIKRLNYEAEVRNKVFERMVSERKRVAEKLRAEGQGARSEILGEKEKILQQIESEAYRTAQEIKGEAEAKATKIYADAHSRDPEFYSFIKTLESYSASLGSADTLVLTTDNEYLSYLKQSGGASRVE